MSGSSKFDVFGSPGSGPPFVHALTMISRSSEALALANFGGRLNGMLIELIGAKRRVQMIDRVWPIKSKELSYDSWRRKKERKTKSHPILLGM
jgi:hypothetical protein